LGLIHKIQVLGGNKPQHLDIVVTRIMDKLAGKEDVVFPPNGGQDD